MEGFCYEARSKNERRNLKDFERLFSYMYILDHPNEPTYVFGERKDNYSGSRLM
jgi:hypothetical protein